ncbi:MAG: H/ACA ribonucleoprotein complex subunit GAR1 [Candidatus Ranarchaeia archaeon]
MNKLGAVLHLTDSHRLIVQSMKIPRFGAFIFDETRKIGFVKDIIGPINRPYISIQVTIPLEEAEKLVGKNLFYEFSRPYQNRRRRTYSDNPRSRPRKRIRTF